jgi:hypothetical protein
MHFQASYYRFPKYRCLVFRVKKYIGEFHRTEFYIFLKNEYFFAWAETLASFTQLMGSSVINTTLLVTVSPT